MCLLHTPVRTISLTTNTGFDTAARGGGEHGGEPHAVPHRGRRAVGLRSSTARRRVGRTSKESRMPDNAQIVRTAAATRAGHVTVRRVVLYLDDMTSTRTRDFNMGVLVFEVDGPRMDRLRWPRPGSPTAPGGSVPARRRGRRDPFVLIEVDDVEATHERAVPWATRCVTRCATSRACGGSWSAIRPAMWSTSCRTALGPRSAARAAVEAVRSARARANGGPAGRAIPDRPPRPRRRVYPG